MKRMREFFVWASRNQVGWDALSFAGLCFLIGGLAAFSPPLAVIVLGLALLFVGIWGARVWAVTRRRPPPDE
jgi:hypothetical protein